MAVKASEISDDLFRRLRARYNDDAHVLLENVGNGAGWGNSGWSDAIAMCVWPSKGLRLIGFEVKATRGDWQRELDRPRKNETWLACCHEWYLVAPADVAKEAELPDGWGLMVPSGATNLRITRRSDRPDPLHVSMDLLAAVFRASGRGMEEVARAMRRDIVTEVESRFATRLQDAEKERDEYREQYRSVCDVLGTRWIGHEATLTAAAEMSRVDVSAVERKVSGMVSALRQKADHLEAFLASDDAGPADTAGRLK